MTSSLVEDAGVVIWFVVAGCWMSVVVCFRVKNLSRVGWDIVVGNRRVLCVIVHGAGNAMLMRGCDCAAELGLMGLGVGSCCGGVCIFDVRSFSDCCFLLRGMVVWCCFFLDLRLYALMCVGRFASMFWRVVVCFYCVACVFRKGC